MSTTSCDGTKSWSGSHWILKFYFSNAPASTPAHEFAQRIGWRWPIETTLEEGKSLP